MAVFCELDELTQLAEASGPLTRRGHCQPMFSLRQAYDSKQVGEWPTKCQLQEHVGQNLLGIKPSRHHLARQYIQSSAGMSQEF